MDGKKSTKNGWIELCRFLACIAIVGYHSAYVFSPAVAPEQQLFVGGYIFVEYFFLLTGYFAGRHFAKSGNSAEILTFMVGKFKRILPMAAFCILAEYAFLLTGFFSCGDPTGRLLRALPFELLFLGNFGLVTDLHYGVLWYLSAMLIALPVLCWLNKKANSFFHSLFLPICSLLMLGSNLLNLPGGMAHWAVPLGEGLAGVLRAIAGCSLGWLLFDLSQRWKATGWQPTPPARAFFTVVEVGLLLFALRNANVRAYSPLDLSTVGSFFFSLLITFCDLSYSDRVHSKFLLKLGKLSLPVYIFHVLTMEVVQRLIPQAGYPVKLGIGLAATLVIASFGWRLADLLLAGGTRLAKMLFVKAPNQTSGQITEPPPDQLPAQTAARP